MTPPRNRTMALRLNILALRFSKHWLRVALTLIGIYVTLPFVAPTLMKLGAPGPARVIYFMYSPLCHQFAFRSFFLFGEQPVYPLESTGTTLKPFESYVKDLPEFSQIPDIYVFSPALQFAARDFVGNEQMGYKVTLCERDIAIYSALWVGGLIYSRIRRWLRPVPLGLYVLLGLGPIGLDGFSQLLGYPPFNFWPARETLPVFRIVTGAIFGLMNAWLAFPYIEMSMRETRQDLAAKLARIGITL